MRIHDDSPILSPTDLSSYLGCRHKTGLDLAVARSLLPRPEGGAFYASLVRAHGEEHERAYVESLRAAGLRVVDARPEGRRDLVRDAARTLEAMREGADVIVQARLAIDGLGGYADILRRVAEPSALGGWSYEVEDTKLAQETRGGTILQLCAYTVMLQTLQGLTPQVFHVVSPGDPGAQGAFRRSTFRLADYGAYYRTVLGSLRAAVARGHDTLLADHYPEPVEACEVCPWASRCEDRRRADDHLSFIAGSTRIQRMELTSQGAPTLAAAAALPVPLPFEPERGARETFERLAHQARVQHEQRTSGRPVFERLPVTEGEGLCRLPPPSPGDVFLDLEGARFARDGGREYLFGLWAPGRQPGYRGWWALDDREEKAAFEEVMDLILSIWEQDPGMHVYHFNHYEPTAFRKLVGRHVTKAEELDRLLIAERFVDLYPVTRQAVRAGVESYSIKQLERYTGYTRSMPLAEVAEPRQAVELALDAGAPEAIDTRIRDVVQGYNEDDCRSTELLRGWLESLRVVWEANGVPVPRPAAKAAEADRKPNPVQDQAVAIRDRIHATLAPEAADPSHADHAYWLLSYLVDWHRREYNADCWEYYRLKELSAEKLLDERKAVAGLVFVAHVAGADRYTYPPQDIDLGPGDELKLQDGGSFGDVVAHDRIARTLDVSRGGSAGPHPAAAFASKMIKNEPMQKSVIRLAERILAGTDECGAELLLGRPPRLESGVFVPHPGESAQDFAVRVALSLDRTVLPIQGPPGAGKTWVGARMIRALVQAGNTVGVTANSHKVIGNLLTEVARQAERAGEQLRLGAKPGDDDDDYGDLLFLRDNKKARAALLRGEVQVLGGTSFFWSREECARCVDVLFVDEAGQMSLANVLAVSQAAGSLVLLGDPRQLDQPEKASHPDGVGISALEHVLGGEETMPATRGVFLPVTWRLSRALTAFTSELFYAGKLEARPGLEAQVLVGAGSLDGSRHWVTWVRHDGNQSSSEEEVDAVVELVRRLLAPGVRWVDETGREHPLSAGDLRIVAPFNAQVNRIAERLPGVPVGTVDKFQGQTCAVVIYSMATSRPEDAPRGMEFLYSLNRLNVATSRARCAVFVVASPLLLEPECRTPRQMQLANALCRYAETAGVWRP